MTMVKSELETLMYIRDLMKPLPSNIVKEDLWINGRFRKSEEYVLINLRMKVLTKIEWLENRTKDM